MLVRRTTIGEHQLTMRVARDGHSATCALTWKPRVPEMLTREQFAEFATARDQVLATVQRDLGVQAVLTGYFSATPLSALTNHHAPAAAAAHRA